MKILYTLLFVLFSMNHLSILKASDNNTKTALERFKDTVQNFEYVHIDVTNIRYDLLISDSSTFTSKTDLNIYIKYDDSESEYSYRFLKLPKVGSIEYFNNGINYIKQVNKKFMTITNKSQLGILNPSKFIKSKEKKTQKIDSTAFTIEVQTKSETYTKNHKKGVVELNFNADNQNYYEKYSEYEKDNIYANVEYLGFVTPNTYNIQYGKLSNAIPTSFSQVSKDDYKTITTISYINSFSEATEDFEKLVEKNIGSVSSEDFNLSSKIRKYLLGLESTKYQSDNKYFFFSTDECIPCAKVQNYLIKNSNEFDTMDVSIVIYKPKQEFQEKEKLDYISDKIRVIYVDDEELISNGIRFSPLLINIGKDEEDMRLFDVTYSSSVTNLLRFLKGEINY